MTTPATTLAALATALDDVTRQLGAMTNATSGRLVGGGRGRGVVEGVLEVEVEGAATPELTSNVAADEGLQ